jgi:hypothetical protein
MKLTQEGKRVKLAEYFGWKFYSIHLNDESISDEEFQEYKESATYCWYRPGNHPWQLEVLPDYFGNLDIIHSATLEAAEKEPSFDIGQAAIQLSCNTKWELYAAPADVRAEILGLTLGLW